MDDVLAQAELVVEAEFASGRLTAVPLEGRACLAEWERGGQRVVLHTSTQVPHLVRTTVAGILGLDEHRVRVVAPDVGGGFGQKCVVAREEVLVCVAARAVGAPVKWVEDRVESLLAGFQGHQNRFIVRAGFDADGRMLAVDADIVADVGAYSTHPFTCGVEPLMAATEMLGPYRVEHYRCRTRAVATNKAPMAPYRGVARPQMVLAMERLLQKAAAQPGDRGRRDPPAQPGPRVPARQRDRPVDRRGLLLRVGRAVRAHARPARLPRAPAQSPRGGAAARPRPLRVRRAHRLRHRGVRAAQDGDHARLRHRARAHGPVGLRAAVGRHLRPRPGPPDHALPGRRRPARA